jgi:hypothetical protein
MLNDITSKFSIDKSLILVSGFSGGARLVSLLAIRDPQFSGVIACGATLPEHAKITSDRKIPYAIVMGDRDMNYMEGLQSTRFLELIQNPVIRIEFHGDHTWPVSDAFEDALHWQLLQKKLLSREKIENAYREKLEQVKIQIDSANWLTARHNATNITSAYRGNLDVHEADSLLKAILLNDDFQKAEKNSVKLLKYEEDQREKFLTQYNKTIRTVRPDTMFKAGEWTVFRNEFTKYKSSDEPAKKQMIERLFVFGWALCAEQSYQLYRQKNYPFSLLNAKIWSALRPDDSRAWVMLARIQAAAGEQKESLTYLKTALKKGFNDKEMLEKDEAFDALRSTGEFKKLMQR